MPPVPLCVGIDIGKHAHVAALLSPSLLSRYKAFDRCPTLPFSNSRSGFESLLALLSQHAPPEHCHVLVEHTGHYGYALEQYLQEQSITLYRVQIQNAPKKKRQKSDKRDARALAVLLYNQIVLAAPVVDPDQQIHQLVTPSATAVQLRGLVRHRLELVRETTQRKNKLTAICDELFPEFTQVYGDPNSPSALALREQYPTPQAIINASLDELAATRKRTLPGREQLAELQRLAVETIGTKKPERLKSIVIEQSYLIAELLLLSEHVDRVTADITAIIAQSREGQILTSFVGIGAIHAATIISQIGSIANFERASKLRGYMGWSPHQAQTGTSYNSVTLTKGGNSVLKQTMYLVAMAAIRHDPSWRQLYDRLVPRLCVYDERKKDYIGKMKVIGRIAGQIIAVIYVLLRRDHDLLRTLAGGGNGGLPGPEVYSVERHMDALQRGGRKVEHNEASSRDKQAGV